MGNKKLYHQYYFRILKNSVGIKDFNGLAGTWKDAEDGELAMNTIATGSVDSIIRHTIST